MAGLTPEELQDIDPSKQVVTSRIEALQSVGFVGGGPSSQTALDRERSPANIQLMRDAGHTEEEIAEILGIGEIRVQEAIDTANVPALEELPLDVPTTIATVDEPSEQLNTGDLDTVQRNPMDTPFNRQDAVDQGELAELREQPSTLVKTGAAIEVFSGTKSLYDLATNTVFEPDPEFRISQFTQEIQETFPPALWETFMHARSESEMRHMMTKAKDEQFAMQTLFDGSTTTGVLLAAGAILTDPTSVIAGVGEFKALSTLGKASRLKRAAVGGVVGAVSAGIVEGVIAADQQTTTADDVVVGAALGFGIGGALGAAFRSSNDLAEARRLGEEVAENRSRAYRPDQGDDAADPVGDSVGAARADTDDTPIDVSDTETDYQAEAELWESTNGKRLDEQLKSKTGKTISSLAKRGIGLDSSRFLSSDSPMMRWFGATFLENGAGLGGRTKTAAILKDRYQHQITAAMLPTYRASYKEWATAQGVTPYNFKGYWSTTKDRFDLALREELEGRRMANSSSHISTDPAINRAADAWQRGKSLELELQKKHGVTGADEVEDIPGYVQLKWQGSKLRKMKDRVRNAYQEDLAKQYRLHLGVDNDVSRVMAKAVFQRAMRKELQLDTNPAALVGADARGMLREMLEDSGLHGERLDNVLHHIDAKRSERGKVSSLRRRNDVDLFADQGGRRLIDLVDNNLDNLAARGAGETSGRVALAARGVKNNADWESLRGMIIKDEAAKAAARGDGTYDPNDTIKLLDSVHAQLHSRPVGEGVNRNARRLTDMAGLSMLGQVGFAQLAELGVLMGEVGVREVISEIPTLKRLRQSIAKGDDVDPDFMDDMEGLIGDIGSDHILYRPEFRFDEDARAGGGRFEATMEKIDRGLAAGQNMLGYASGMNIVKGIEQRMAVRILTNKVAKLATGRNAGKKLTPERLADLGWDDKTLGRIKTQMNKHTVWEGDTLKRINLEAWEPEIAEELAIGVNRFTATVVQKSLVGQSATWMHSTMGAMLTQFRSFPIIAMEKQLARNTLHNDMQSYTTAMYGLTVAAGVHLMKTAVNAPGLTQEQIEERLQPATIARQAIQYTGMAGLLPDGMTFMAALGVLPPEMAYGAGRVGTSRPINPALQSIPAAGVAVDMANIAGGSIKALELWGDDYDWGKRDVSAWQGAVPLGNTVPMAVGFGLLKQAVE